jgi:hypothetical protein
MADVTGPISTLPGARHRLPEGATCDQHPDRPAVARVQGETDSMGCEMYDLCAECLAADREAERTRDPSGTCEWCKTHKPRLRLVRDYDEGLYGRVYEACDDCIKRRDERIEEEWAGYDDFDFDFDP